MDIVNFITTNWEKIAIIVLAFNTFIKAIRDAFDKTPTEDNNFFEHFATIIGKVSAYLLIGKRAK